MTLQVFSNTDSLGRAAAAHIAKLSAGASAARRRFTVAISGGSLPKLIAPALTSEPLRSQIDWESWHVFFADERCVPLDHPDSNARLVRAVLFDHVSLPPAQLYTLNDSLAPADAARDYEQKLQRLFGSERPRFDLILLGMGEDGHTASLFPDHPLLKESQHPVAAIFNSPKPPPERITLTLPVLCNARHVAFVAAGAGKSAVLPQVLAPNSPLPAGLVQPVSGTLDWFVDEVASTNLNKI